MKKKEETKKIHYVNDTHIKGVVKVYFGMEQIGAIHPEGKSFFFFDLRISRRTFTGSVKEIKKFLPSQLTE